MPRKSPLESYAEQFADYPPLVGVVAALIFAGLGWALPLFASSPLTQIWLQMGRWLLWLVGFAVLLAMAGGVIRRARDRRLFDSTDDPAALSWPDFERLVAEHYRRDGGTVTVRGGPSADGGVDLEVLTRDRLRLLVQCKQWRNRRVGVKVVRELWGVVAGERADGAVCITSGSFSEEAIRFAAGKPLELVDGPRLRKLIATVRAAAPAPSPVAAGPAALSPPACPRCGSPMVLRTARHGAHAGEQFWGCSTYPACKATLPH